MSMFHKSPLSLWRRLPTALTWDITFLSAVLVSFGVGLRRDAQGRDATCDKPQNPAARTAEADDTTARKKTDDANAAEIEICVIGKVVDGKGQPVGGVQVQLFDWSKYKNYAKDLDGGSKTTDVQGNFSFVVRRRKLGIYEAWFVARDAAGNRQGLVVCDPATIEENSAPQITLKPMRQVTVIVVDAQGAPIAGARVVVANVSSVSLLVGTAGGAVLSGETGADGRAVLRFPADAWQNPIAAFKSGCGLDYFFVRSPPDGGQPESLPGEITLSLTGAAHRADQGRRPISTPSGRGFVLG